MVITNDIDITCKENLKKLSEFSSTFANSLVCWKDTDSNFLFANNFLVKLAGFKSSDEVLENKLSDYDFKCRTAELAPIFRAEDREIIQTRKPSRFLTYALYSFGPIVILGNKVPVFDSNGKMIAIALNYLDISKTNFALSKVSLYDTLKKRQINSNPVDQFSIRLDTTSPLYENLSKREAECLFYLIYGNTAKEIARNLGISFRTVEYYIDILKQKFKCDKKSVLIEKAIHLGYLNFLPPSLMDQDLSSSIK